MNIDTKNARAFELTLEKVERYYAFKYEVMKKDIGFIIRGKAIHVLVDGKLKETIRPSAITRFRIDEETLKIK